MYTYTPRKYCVDYFVLDKFAQPHGISLYQSPIKVCVDLFHVFYFMCYVQIITV